MSELELVVQIATLASVAVGAFWVVLRHRGLPSADERTSVPRVHQAL